MAIDVLRAAKYIGKVSDWSLSHLYIQKLLYLTHMCFLGAHDGKPLVLGNFEASDFGPIHPRLYHKAKIFGADPVRNIFRRHADLNKEDTADERSMLDWVYTELEGASGAHLVHLTHLEGGAWAKNYRPGAHGIIIRNEEILEDYRRRIEEVANRVAGETGEVRDAGVEH